MCDRGRAFCVTRVSFKRLIKGSRPLYNQSCDLSVPNECKGHTEPALLLGVFVTRHRKPKTDVPALRRHFSPVFF